MRFSITQKLTLTILLFIGAGVAVVFYLILPALTSIKDTTDAMVTQITAEEEELDRLRLLRRSLSEIEQIDSDLSEVDNISIVRGDEDELIQTLELIAATHSIDQNLSVSFTPESVSPEFSGYYVFNFSAKGMFEDIREYLSDIEKLPYYFSIPKITIEKTSTAGPEIPFVVIQFTAVLNSTSS